MTLSNLGAHRAAAAFVVTLAASSHALCVPQAEPAAQSEETLRHYDLRPALTAGVPPPAGVTMDLHVSTSAIDALEPEGYDVWLGPENHLEADKVLEAVRFAVSQTDGAKADDLDVDQRWLHLTGNAAAHRAAAAALGQLESLNLDGVDVEVLVVPRTATPAGSSGWLSAEATDKLLAEIPSHRASQFPVRIGRSTTLDQTRTRSFLYTYDIEVAQGAFTADPVVSILRTGTHLGVRVDRAADGEGFVVRTWGRRGKETDPMRSVTLPSFADAPLELPAVRSSIWASSARLAPGEAMVLDTGTDELMLIRIVGGKRPAAAPRLSLGEYALDPMRPNLLQLPRTEPSQGYRDYRGDVDDFGPEGLMDSPEEQETLEQLGQNGTPLVGTHLICPEGSRSAQEASAAIQSLVQARPITEYAIDVQFRVLDAEKAQAVRGTTDWSTFAEQPAMMRLSSTTIGDDATLMVSGFEEAYLQDHDVQVAAGAIGPQPIVKSTFQGASIWCSPMKTTSGSIRAWFDVQFLAELESRRDLRAASYHPAPGSGNKDNPHLHGDMRLDLPIELPVTESAGGASLASLTDGAWGHVVTQPLGDTGNVLVVIAKIKTR